MKKAATVLLSCVIITSLYSQDNNEAEGDCSCVTEEYAVHEPFPPEESTTSLDRAQGLIPTSNAYDYSTIRLTIPLQPLVDQAANPTCVTWSGFVKLDTFWDSRQIRQSLNGLSILFPLPKKLDPTGRDINAQGLFNMLAIQTLLRASVQGPEILRANTSAAIEGDFIGSIILQNVSASADRGSILGLFRLRHAFASFDWPHINLLWGQYWNPLFVPLCTPATLAFDGGTPVALLARNLQIRLTYHQEPSNDFNWLIFGAMYAEGNEDFTDGPLGLSSAYTKSSATPMFSTRVDVGWKRHYFGAGVSTLRIRPRLSSNTGFKVNETLSSVRGTAFASINWEHFGIRTKLNIGQNMTNLSMLGGYAVSSIDPITDERTYANLTTAGWWVGLTALNSFVEPGLYFGVSKNLGSNKPIITQLIHPDGTSERTVYGEGTDIDTLFLIIPRVRFNIKNLTFGFELQFTRAAFGTINPCDGRVFNTDPVTDVRALFMGFYFF